MNDLMNAFILNHIDALHHFSCFFQNSSSNYISLSDIEIKTLMDKSLSYESQQKIAMYYIGAIDFLVKKNDITFDVILQDGTTGYSMLIHSATAAIEKIFETSKINSEVTAPILLSHFFKSIALDKLNDPSHLSNFDHITELGYTNCQLFFDGTSEIINAGGKIFYVNHEYVSSHHIESFIFNNHKTRTVSNQDNKASDPNNEVFEDPSIHNDSWYDIKNSEQYKQEKDLRNKEITEDDLPF